MNEIKTDRVYNKIEKKILEKHPDIGYINIEDKFGAMVCDRWGMGPIQLDGYFSIEQLQDIIKICKEEWNV